MALVKISELPDASALTGAEVYPFNQNGNTKKGGSGGGLVTSSAYVTPGLVTDQTTGMQAFLDAWASSKGIAVLAPGNYNCNSALLFNHVAGGAKSEWILFAYGATITSTHNGVILGDAFPADMTAANALLQRRIHIHGLSITGNGQTGQTGIRLTCRYLSRLQDMYVQNCGTNYDFSFCLQGKVSACNSAVAVNHGYRIRSGAGLWTDATGPNSASNHFLCTDGTRDYASNGQLTQFYVEDSQGVVLRDCVTEGGNPVNAIHYSTIIHDVIYGHSGGRTFGVSNHHGENFPTNAHMKLDAYSGHVIVDQFDTQTGGTIIDGSGSSITSVIYARLPTIVSSPSLKTIVGGPRWELDISSNYGAVDFGASGAWVGGIVGTYASVRFNDAAAEPGIPNVGFGIDAAQPFLHASQKVYIISDTAKNVPGIRLDGATAIGVGSDIVGTGFLNNGEICASADDLVTGLLNWSIKTPNGYERFVGIPWGTQAILGYPIVLKTAAPADGDVPANQALLWFDNTAGAAKLMIKAKDAGGTVRTGSVNLA